MSGAVSICDRTEWPFSFIDTYFRFDLVLGREVSTRLCFSLVSVFVMWSLECYFVHRWGAECLFMSLLFALSTAVYLE